MPADNNSEFTKRVEEYTRERQLADRIADELFSASFPIGASEHGERGYYTLDSKLFPRLRYAIKTHLSGCYVTVYDRLRKPEVELQTIKYRKVGWMCISQDVFLPEGDKLLQVGLMLRDREREVLNVANWNGSAWTKTPYHHIKKYIAGRKTKR